jgi:hypothetical protein
MILNGYVLVTADAAVGQTSDQGPGGLTGALWRWGGSVWAWRAHFGYTALARPDCPGVRALLARSHGVWGNWQPDGFWPR